MISFKVVTEENKDLILSVFSESLSEAQFSDMSDFVSSFDLSDEDTEIALSFFCGCLLVRIFDMGRYFFFFPTPILENADVHSAVLAVGEYAMREEVALTFCGVMSEDFPYLSGFRHMDIDAEDSAASSYRVRIKTECEFLEEIPHVAGERVKLRELLPEDIPLYAELCKDENVNKYWGYDYKEDVFSPEDSYFFENAALEFSRGVAFSMAVDFGGEFIGECTLYAFDGRGGAEFSIRLLPEFHGKGLGSEAVGLIFDAARQVGLIRLFAKVSEKNAASVAMLSHYSKPDLCTDGTLKFEFLLDEKYFFLKRYCNL